jgi:uncharacterized protein YlxW (UPF0749 family)
MLNIENISINESAERDLKTLAKIRAHYESWTVEYKLLTGIINEKSAKALEEIESVDNGGVPKESETTLTDRLYQELVDERKKNERLQNEINVLESFFKNNEKIG